MVRPTICLCLILCHLGCAARQVVNITPVSRSADTLPTATVLTTGGKYLLRTSPNDPNVRQNPMLIERELRAGDSLGFARSDNGELHAVAGKDRITLAPGFAYEWCLEVLETKSEVVREQTKRVLRTVAITTVCIIVVAAIVYSYVEDTNGQSFNSPR